MSENPTSRLIFSGPTVTIGEFRCPPGHPLWREENIARGVLMVFPRVPVGIDQAGREPVLADPNTVMFYNAGQPYRRRLVSGRGDECEFFVIDPALAAETVRQVDPAAEAPSSPFRFSHGPGESRAYLLQRRLCDRIRAGEPVDSLEVEETTLALLAASVEGAWILRHRPVRARNDTTRAHADLAEAAKLVLAQKLAGPLPLSVVARAVHSSPFHLCRVFHRQTGMTLHRYRDRLRLRDALERLTDRRRTLLCLALDLGYSSHSHFTQAFRNAFGITPSDLQDIYQSQLAEKQNHSTLHDSMSVFSATHYRQLFK